MTLFNYEEPILTTPTLRDWQAKAIPKMLGFMRNNDKIVLCIPTGCHAKGTKILTYSGNWLNAEDIRVGDILMGDDSKPRVVHKLHTGKDKMFKITPVKGKPFIVNGEHILSLLVYTESQLNKVITHSTKIDNISVNDYLLKSPTYKHCAKLYRPEFINFDTNHEVKYPYLIGAFLGDGCLSQKGVTITLGVKKQSIVEELIKFSQEWDGCYLSKQEKERNNCHAYRVASTKPGYNPVLNWFRELGLMEHKAGTKSIPYEYKTASIKDRLEILAGLMDTDGSLSRGGFDYISKSERLANDVVFICQSLGLAAYKTECIKSCQNNFSGVYYRVSISGDCSIIPTRIKRAAPRQQIKSALRTGFSIEPLPVDDYYGFSVDGNNLYIMEDFFVTHNCGKTVAAGVIIADYVKRGKKVLFVVDRLVLIQQTIESFASLGIRCDILQGMNSTHTNAPVIVASQQTLVRRDLPTELSAVFADECHVLSGAFKKIINELDIPVVGLSATPFTKGMSKIFNRLYNPYTTKQATDDGVLVPLKVIECVKMDMSNVKKIGGEYSDHDVEEKGIEIIGDVVAEYKRYANNKAIAFCATIKQCMALSDELNSNGVPSAIFCATTTSEERKEILRLYNNTNEIMVLVSVAALATGFDARCIKTVLDCRPLSRSLSLYIQSIGRGLRSMDGKESCLLLDFTGNMRKFSADFVDFYLNGIDSLNSGEKKDRTRKEEPEKPKKDGNGCPECQSSLWVRANNTMHCLACGYDVKPDIEKFETQKFDYKTQELDIFSAKRGETNNELWGNCCLYAQNKFPSDKELAKKRAKFYYKNITGEWPLFTERFKVAKKSNPEIINKIVSMNIAYAKAKYQ